jgi:hypothetical protein
LLLQAMQLVRGRWSFRLAEVVYTISVVRREPLDWSSVMQAARHIGALPSLSCYLDYVTQIYERVFAGRLVHDALVRRLLLDGWGPVEFTGGAFRFPALRVSSRLYASQLGADLRSGRWHGAGRLCLLPVVAAALALGKLGRAASPPAAGHRRGDERVATCDGSQDGAP